MQLRGRVVFIIFFESLSILGFQNQEVEWVGKWYLIHRALKPRYVSKNNQNQKRIWTWIRKWISFSENPTLTSKKPTFLKRFLLDMLFVCSFYYFLCICFFFMWLNNVKWIAKFIVSHIGDSFLKIVRIFANV